MQKDTITSTAGPAPASPAHKQMTDLLAERSLRLDAIARVLDGALLECEIKENVFHPFTDANDKALALTGLTRDELLATTLTDALSDIAGKERKKVLLFLAAKAKLLAEGETVSFEARLRFGVKEFAALVRIASYRAGGALHALIIIADYSKESALAAELDYKTKEFDGLKNALDGLYLKVNKDGVIQEYKTNDMRFNIAVFPGDFMGKDPGEYLDKETLKTYRAALAQVLKTGVGGRGGFHMRYGAEDKFYEASLVPVIGGEEVIVLLSHVDRRKGLEDKIRELYAIASNRSGAFVRTMEDILSYGKQVFGADIALVLHFCGKKQERVLINHATQNHYGFNRGVETLAGNCFDAVRAGQVFACASTMDLPCPQGCLHRREEVSSLIAAPLRISGRVEGAIVFLTLEQNHMHITEEERNFVGFIGDLLGMALELRAAKKAVDSGLSTLKKLISSLDAPAVIIDTSQRIKNANAVMLNICGYYDVSEIEGQGFFPRFAADSERAAQDFASAYKASRSGVFDIEFSLLLSGAKAQNLLWHALEVKDGKGVVRGFLLVSESVKDIPAVRELMGGPATHI